MYDSVNRNSNNKSSTLEKSHKRGKMPGSNSKLEIAEDGEIIYQGDISNIDSIFPPDGVIKIKQAPP